MPLFAKFLAFVNVLVACLFVYLAFEDRNARQPWAYEVFLSEIALDGIPLDEDDPGPRRIDSPLYADVDSDKVLGHIFEHTKDKALKPVATQKAEVERRKKEVADDIAKAGDKREAIRSYLLPLASSLDERFYWAERSADKEVATKDLEADLMDFFDRALSDRVEREKHDYVAAEQEKKSGKKTSTEQTPFTRRQRVAHLLYNLSPDLKQHQRVLVVVGLRAYVNEAEGQAARLREMSQRTRLAMIDERANFEIEYERLVQRLLTLSEDVFQRQAVLADKEKLRERAKALVDVRTKDVGDLMKQLEKEREEVEVKRVEQADLEKRLFAAQKALGDLKEKTENLARNVKGLERR